ncbi:MAG: hypothetical protein MUC63_08090, partial [Planctomycetes bacterium]|nr:hypothetical protein [Planctomycetota bacterium]
VVWAGAWAAAQEPEPATAPALETRLFDLRQLTTPLPFQAGPVFSLGERVPPGEQALPDNLLEVSEEQALVTEDQIRETIEEDDPEVLWNHEGTLLRFLHGRLLVRHRPEVLERVAVLLRALEKASPPRATLTALAFAAPFPPLPDREALTAAEGRELADRIRKGAGWWEEISATGSAEQRFYAAKGAQFLYVAEYDVEVASSSSISDPVMAVAETGIVIDARPVFASARGVFVANLRISCAHPAAPGAPEAVRTPGGQMHLPSLRRVSFRGTVTVPDSGWILLGTERGEPAGGTEGGTTGLRFLVTITGGEGK